MRGDEWGCIAPIFMTEDQYIESILNKYSVPYSAYSPASRVLIALTPAIEKWAGKYLIKVHFSGSYAKRTAINIGTDVDIFISLSSYTPKTLSEIYDSLYLLADSKGWSPTKRNVSIGITYQATKVDLVPGRIQKGYSKVHSLFKHRTNSWIQTNVYSHILRILLSGRQKEIRAIKIWSKLHNLDFPSFYLELFVIQSLKYQPKNNLASNVLKALECIASDLEYTRMVDPENSNNVISDDLTMGEKKKISNQALESRNKSNWGEVLW